MPSAAVSHTSLTLASQTASLFRLYTSLKRTWESEFSQGEVRLKQVDEDMVAIVQAVMNAPQRLKPNAKSFNDLALAEST